MIASLPMYDWPELQSVNDALWDKLRDRFYACGINVPEKLSHSNDDGSHWLLPELIFGQTCGYPFSTMLKGKVRYLATPVYGVEGCSKANYSSAIIAHKDSAHRKDKLRGKSFAYNSTMSWSGYRTMMLEYGRLDDYFATMIVSGGHRQSANIVAAGTADIAAIDAVCWHFLQRHEPGTADNLKVIGWSGPKPALPFITSILTPPTTIDKLRLALGDVLAATQNAEICESLALNGCEILDPDIYSPLGDVG
jgi:ABC-type phosphate/phosphonate transport system substrate-binding protein